MQLLKKGCGTNTTDDPPPWRVGSKAVLASCEPTSFLQSIRCEMLDDASLSKSRQSVAAGEDAAAEVAETVLQSRLRSTCKVKVHLRSHLVESESMPALFARVCNLSVVVGNDCRPDTVVAGRPSSPCIRPQQSQYAENKCYHEVASGRRSLARPVWNSNPGFLPDAIQRRRTNFSPIE